MFAAYRNDRKFQRKQKFENFLPDVDWLKKGPYQWFCFLCHLDNSYLQIFRWFVVMMCVRGRVSSVCVLEESWNFSLGHGVKIRRARISFACR